jgi:hypothetical protein
MVVYKFFYENLCVNMVDIISKIYVLHSLLVSCILNCYPRFLGITRRSCLEAHRS